MKVLCAWEFGSGFGHLTRLRPFVHASLETGFEVVLALKELERARSTFGSWPVRLFKAPHFVDPPLRYEPLSWVEYLLARYQSSSRLTSFILAWNSIFDAVQPDLVIYDAAPTALLASFGFPWLKWTVGSPFFMPRIDLPFIGLFPTVKALTEISPRLRESQDRLLLIIQDSFIDTGKPAIFESISSLLQVDQELLTTIPGFDYYGPRPSAKYIGMPGSIAASAQSFAWPSPSRLKIFAYLKGFGHKLKHLIAALNRSGHSMVIYAPDVPKSLESDFPGHCFLSGPASMNQVCAESDLVIHTGGSQTVAQCLASGIPQLLLVPALEQRFTALAARQLGPIVACNANQESYLDAVDEALRIARMGRVAPPTIDISLLNGASYDANVKQLVSSLFV